MSKQDKLNFARQKSSLEKAIEEVELWQKLSCTPLFLTTVKAQNSDFGEELRQAKHNIQDSGQTILSAAIAVRSPLSGIKLASILIPAEKMRSVRAFEIRFSSVRSIRVGDRWGLLDPLPYDKDAICELAVRLRSADPSTFGLLRSEGAIEERTNRCRYSMVFQIPGDMSDPTTLRAKIMANDVTHSLSERFQLATQLARAVFSVHTFDMVHKSIRPENIILLKDSRSTLGSAFLLGFESLRLEQGLSRRGTVDEDWEKNIYRHPHRQGRYISQRYRMQHDIYSLGVCLLEIGLWTSFVEYRPHHYGDKTTYSLVKPNAYDLYSVGLDEPGQAEFTKSRLIGVATKELPRKMGTKYAEVVKSCLTCLDVGNEDFGLVFGRDLDDGMMAVEYIKKVITANV